MIEVESELAGTQDSVRALIERAMDTTFRREGRGGDVCVRLVSEEEIQRLNRTFRGIDRVTDVLTFPAWEGEELLTLADGYLGDVAICRKRAEEQAVEYGHPLEREIAFLAVHGALHLLGYDHMQPDDEAVMTRKQREILEEMEIGR